jgi:arginine exporter protein ArgO
MVASVIAEFIGAAVLGWFGYLSWTRAVDYRERNVKDSQKLKPPWRSILYPQWYWRSDLPILSMRGASIGWFIAAIALLIIATVTLLTGHAP